MNRILFITFIIFLIACSSTSEPVTSAKQTIVDNTEIVKPLDKIPTGFECIRGEPEPSLNLNIFPSRKFTSISKTKAIETASLTNGDQLIIKHGGCEYFVQTYRFETSRFQADTSNLIFWYKNAVKLLNEIASANESPIDINAGLYSMINYIDTYSEKNLNAEIEIVDSEIRQFVTLDRIEQLGNDRFGIEVTFSIGPL
jgi:hypothetical protein